MAPRPAVDRGWLGGQERRALGLVLVLVAASLAGCGLFGGGEGATPTASVDVTATPTSSATPTPTETATATPTPSAAQLFADASVDPGVIWDRSTGLLGVNGTEPRHSVGDTSVISFVRPGLNILIGPPNRNSTSFSAYVPNGALVILSSQASGVPSDRLEALIAHEYVHVVQYQQDWFAAARDATSDRSAFARRTFSEGMAVFVADAYARRHLNLSVSPAERMGRLYTNGTTRGRLILAAYHYGFEYYERRIEDPANVTRVVADPPQTTEQVLHRTDEGSRELDVETADPSSDWFVDTDRYGELGTRIILRDQLSRSRARTAAAGWGADAVRQFVNARENLTGIAWVHRWDTIDDADEFESAARTFADRRGAESDAYEFRVERVAPETTALIGGEPAFVDDVVVQGDNETVEIRP